jgi:hypothetical protein
MNAVTAPAAPPTAADRLNRDCRCTTLRREDLRAAMMAELGDAWSAFAETRPHLFSGTAVFLARSQMTAMTEAVTAIEAAARTPAYRAAALQRAPEIARHDFGPRNAFMGYDFHLTPAGLRLIEVNTNAGGAFLNARMAAAHAICCGTAPMPAAADFAARVVAMFRAEWSLQNMHEPLRRAGIDAVIADGSALERRDGALQAGGAPVDLVYNRLVDFTLAEPRHAALRDAYAAGAVAVTPNPHVHALHADKRNLVLLSHALALDALPDAVEVTAANASALWENRKAWFFKPAAGYGSRAVYRGDKVTRRVWDEIVNDSRGYVAQAFAAPSERTVVIDGVS